MSRLDVLSKNITELQDRQLLAMPMETPRHIGEQLIHRRNVRRLRRAALGATAVILLAGGSLWGLRSHWVRTNPAAVTAQAGQELTSRTTDMQLAFEDGSRAWISPGTTLQTELASGTDSSVRLQRGSVRARVIHRAATRFAVHAGPYTVEVTGTRFQVDWRPDTGAFSTRVEEGSVVIRGGLLSDPVIIGAGQSLTLEQGRVVAAPASAAVRASERAPAAVEPPAEGPPPAVMLPSVESTPAHRPAVHRAAPALPGWRVQAQSGRFREALAAAEKQGFESICREASSADLLSLAEAARYANQAPRAEQALAAVRSRFANSDDAALAAYVLGRLAAEVRRDHAGASRWFHVYLLERPNGKLAREAEGRLLESLAFMDRSSAREAARRYLDRYPNGPHATFARNLLAP